MLCANYRTDPACAEPTAVELTRPHDHPNTVQFSRNAENLGASSRKDTTTSHKKPGRPSAPWFSSQGSAQFTLDHTPPSSFCQEGRRIKVNQPCWGSLTDSDHPHEEASSFGV